MANNVLKIFIVFGAVLLPFAFIKKPVKDWLIVYLLTALFSALVDHVLVGKKLLSYPIRIFPNLFKYHLVFDLLLCPVVSIFYNQWTYRDKSLPLMMGKLLFFTIPQLVIESMAGRYFKMVKWHRGWNWYNTFITMNIKYLSIRALMGFVRMVSKKQERNTTCL